MSDEAGVSDICESCGCFARIYDKGLCEECYECEVEKINNRVSDIGSEYDSDDETHDFYNESIMRTQSCRARRGRRLYGRRGFCRM